MKPNEPGATAEHRPRGRTLEATAEGAAEVLLAAGFLFAMDGLAHLKLTPGGFGLVLAGWVVALAAARLVRRSATGPAWLPVALELMLPVLWLMLWSDRFKQSWTGPQVLYAAGFVAAAWQGWRWLLARAAGAGGGPVAEGLRLLLVGAIAAGTMAPYFTDLQVGGRDASWYTSVFIDFLQQMRAGFFPVFLGQGELSYNGSANLFRSAPLCLWIGGAWDVLTWQSLSPVAIRNLSLITAALGAGFGMYAAQVKLLGVLGADRACAGWAHWAAALGAGLYVLCPGVMMSLGFYELQMTFTALLALPWVLHGNARVLLGTDGRGYVPLAIGLALAWLAHAPLAIIAMLCTAALQLGHFIFNPAAWAAQGRSAVCGGVLFALLSAYYFLGMSELAGTAAPSLPREAGFLLGIILLVSAGVRAFHFRQWLWLPGLLAGGGLIAWLAPVWLSWAVFWTALWAAGTAGLRWVRVPLDNARAVLLAAVAMLAAAALAQQWVAGRPFSPDALQMKELELVLAARADLFRPVSAGLGRYGDCQPGYALWGLAAIGLLGAWWSRTSALALLAAVAGLIVALIVSLPGISHFIVGFAPAHVANLVNLPMLYRLVPPLAALVVIMAFVTLVRFGAERSWARVATLALLAAGVLWSGRESRRVLELGFTRIASRASTEAAFSPDRFPVGRYPYLMLYIPTYFMDGKQMSWLESRLLTPHYDVIVGPDQIAWQAEKVRSESWPLTSQADESYPEWRRFTPGWEVQPGETVLLRFEFDPAKDPSGWLIMSSDRIYLEYILDPRYGGAGFGAGPMATRTIAITNSGQHTERFTMRMKIDSGNTLPLDGGTWGALHISRYDKEKSPIKQDSLLPYRVRVTISEDGYLETPRQWIAGYRAWVDGVRTEPQRMKSGMLGIPLKKGDHEVVLKFTGSAKLWTGLVISAATLLGLLIRGFAGEGRGSVLREKFHQWIQANRT